jgi:hypothetical protein
MHRKLYLIQPTYRNPEGILHQGTKLAYCSLALPALSAAIPSDWEKECMCHKQALMHLIVLAIHVRPLVIGQTMKMGDPVRTGQENEVIELLPILQPFLKNQVQLKGYPSPFS